MPDYVYLLENRLSPAQREAVRIVRDTAREESMTVFLTGGAVRDLTTGSPVRDLDFSVQGNALSLKDRLTDAGGTLWGEHAPSRTLFFSFPGSVRVEVSSTRREQYAKPGKPEYIWDTILEDLRRRDFTANAMALSLNDMSFGLLMDPLNGIADIEQRTLRLVSNYGFLESPVRMLRAARLAHRLAWTLDEKTQTRLENAKEEGLMQQLSAYDKGYELEEIGHEENPLAALQALEEQGWMKELFPAWTSAKADLSGLEQMHEVQTRLQMQGVYPDVSTAAMELLTARLQPKDLESLKKLFVRPGFVKQWARLNQDAEDFARQLTAKEAATPSATWKLFQTANPAAILWLGLTGKSAAVQAKFKNFFNVWPESRQQLPLALMQEMRITPEVPGYAELVENYFYGLIDGHFATEEAIRAFLEPYSPPAPPPPVKVTRTRASKKAGSKKAAALAAEELDDEESEDDEEKVDADDDEEEAPVKLLPKVVAPKPAPAKPAVPPAPKTSAEKPAPVVPPAAVKPAPAAKPAPAVKAAPAKASAVKSAAKPAPVKTATKGKAPAKAAAKVTKPAPVEKKSAIKPAAKPAAKKSAKPEPKKAPVKPAPKPAGKAPAKPAAKKAGPAKSTARKPAPKNDKEAAKKKKKR